MNFLNYYPLFNHVFLFSINPQLFALAFNRNAVITQSFKLTKSPSWIDKPPSQSDNFARGLKYNAVGFLPFLSTNAP